MQQISGSSEEYPGVEFVGEVTIYPNVAIGPGSVVYGPCILGQPSRGKAPGEVPLVIGQNALIRSFAVLYAGATIGDRFECGHYAVILADNVIGDDCSVGGRASLWPRNRIGNRVRMHVGAGMEAATVEDDVTIGAYAIFTSDPHPPCPQSAACQQGVTIKRAAVIGLGVLVLPGRTVGRRAVVGTGSIVTKDVPDEVVVAGNPAHLVKRLEELECWTGLYDHPYQWSEWTKEDPGG